jgi:hypothetical protein
MENIFVPLFMTVSADIHAPVSGVWHPIGDRVVLSTNGLRKALIFSTTLLPSGYFDPGSARLNSEMGFVIESDSPAQGITNYLNQGLRDQACEVRKTSLGCLE